MLAENPTLLDITDSNILYYEEVDPCEARRTAYADLLTSLSEIANLSSDPSAEHVESILFQIVCDTCLAVYATNALGFRKSDPAKMARVWAEAVMHGPDPLPVQGASVLEADFEVLEQAVLCLVFLLSDSAAGLVHRREVPLQAEEVIRAVSPWINFVQLLA